jgi:hypothetical protein
MSTIQQITDAPEGFSRNDPSGFRVAADDYVDWTINTHVPETQTMITEINTATDEIDENADRAEFYGLAAIAAANATWWVVGTTYTQGGGAIGSNGYTYISLVAANIGNDPISDDGTNWARTTGPFLQGVAVSTASSDIILTKNSDKFQSVSMSGTGKTIKLPDATTITPGTPFTFQNSGAYIIDVIDGDGVSVTRIQPGSIVNMFLLDSAATAGDWAFYGGEGLTDWVDAEYDAGIIKKYRGNLYVYKGYGGGIGTTPGIDEEWLSLHEDSSNFYYSLEYTFAPDGSTGDIACVALDTSRILVLYSDYGDSNYGKAVVVTVSGVDISVGTATTFESAGVLYLSVAKVGTDKVVISYRATGNLIVRLLTISTATVTSGNSYSYGLVSAAPSFITTMDTDKALVCFYESGTGMRASVVSVSTDTPAMGTVETICVCLDADAESSKNKCVTLTTDKAMIFTARTDTAGEMKAYILTVIHNTVIAGPKNDFTAIDTATMNDMVVIDSSNVLLCYLDSLMSKAIILSVSGNAVTENSATTCLSMSSGVGSISCDLTSSTSALLSVSNGNSGGNEIGILTINGTDVTFEDALVPNDVGMRVKAINLDTDTSIILASGYSGTNPGAAKVVRGIDW